VPLVSVLALLLFVLYYTSRPSHHGGVRAAATSSSVVIVTTLDLKLSEQFREAIKDNRRQYAAKYGYATFFPNASDYDLGSWPQSWSLVPALRHAMTLHPDRAWMWYLSSSALIMNTSQSLDSKLLAPRTLETLAIANQPVVPDSAIKTYPNLKGERVDIILTYDGHGLSVDSFFVRTGDWAKYFLDMWFDPLYRSYNFAAAEKHALEHIVQWHMTVFARLVLVPQRLVNSYWRGNARSGGTKDAGK
jgi:mannan polymerase II complex MNN11 subunit